MLLYFLGVANMVFPVHHQNATMTKTSTGEVPLEGQGYDPVIDNWILIRSFQMVNYVGEEQHLQTKEDCPALFEIVMLHTESFISPHMLVTAQKKMLYNL